MNVVNKKEKEKRKSNEFCKKKNHIVGVAKKQIKHRQVQDRKQVRANSKEDTFKLFKAGATACLGMDPSERPLVFSEVLTPPGEIFSPRGIF